MGKKIKEDVDKSHSDQTAEVIKQVKTKLLDCIVREWLQTPVEEWGGKTPLQLLKKGEGNKILLAIEKADEELKMERSVVDKKQLDRSKSESSFKIRNLL